MRTTSFIPHDAFIFFLIFCLSPCYIPVGCMTIHVQGKSTLMESIPEPNPAPRITILDLLQTSFTVCFRLPWVVGTTLLRRWWPWNHYKNKPALREHIFRHFMTCLGNHIPLSLWQWYMAADTSGNNIRTSARYGHISHIFQPVRREDFCGFWICRGLSHDPIEPRDADLVLLHCHGGGYVSGHPAAGAPEHLFLAEVFQQHNLTTAIFSLDYTLTPKARFPKQRDEVLATYDWLREELGVDPSKIVVIGDSAGGHAIMSLLVGLHERRQKSPGSNNPRPAAAVLVSPWLNLYSSHPRALAMYWEERLFKRSLDTYCKWILRDASPELALMYGNFAVGRDIRGSWADILPRRTWISAGAEEFVFLYDMEDVVSQAKEDGAEIVLEVTEGNNHTWQCAEAFGQQNRFLSLKPDEEPKGLMEGYRAIALEILKLIQS